MQPLKIIRTDSKLQTPLLDETLKQLGHHLLLLLDGSSEDELCREIADADLLLTCYTPVNARVLSAAKHLRGVIKYGVGIDAIDVPAANTRGMVVVNIPEYAEETVAEGAFAMLIALARRLPEIGRQMLSDGWAWPEEHWLGSDIASKTLGIIGCGRIGSSMARIAGQGFRMRVIGYDPYKTDAELKAAGIKKMTHLPDLLQECHFLSMHAVLTAETKHMIGAKELALLPENAFLINSARGALIDETALMHALKKKQIAGAGLDVFSIEPLNRKDHPLRSLYTMANVILLPHLTFYTIEAMQRLQEEVLARVAEFTGEQPVTIKSTDPRLLNQSKTLRDKVKLYEPPLKLKDADARRRAQDPY
jgi:D-3-phosphoglycerate dehydrogenase